jgi:glycosyltransferase involved in cell wall biosynthesis
MITRLNVGGPGRQALLLTRALEDEFPTALLAGRPARHEGELVDPQVPVETVPLRRAVRPLADVAALHAVRRVLDAARPAILHTHTAKAGAVGRLAARSLGDRGPRTVHTFHGHVLQGYFGHAVERGFVAAERQLARWTDVIVAVSPEVRDQLLDLGIGRPRQFHVLPVGIELDRYLAVDGPSGRFRSRIGVPTGVPLVGVVGRLVPIKAVHVAIAALARLPGAHMAIVGDGEERHRLEADVRHRGLADRVHFTGWVDDVAGALADCDVVASSSRNEGTPVALIEALAARRPVVATGVGGVRSVVVPGRTGLVVDRDDPEALAEAVATLLRDRELALRLAAAGRAHAAARFGADRLVDDVRALYRELVG